MAYVSTDGNYGGEDSLHFDLSELSNEQWETLDNIPDSDRYYYVFAILNGDEETAKEYEEMYA